MHLQEETVGKEYDWYKKEKEDISKPKYRI
jgi:hypothetical protein